MGELGKVAKDAIAQLRVSRGDVNADVREAANDALEEIEAK